MLKLPIYFFDIHAPPLELVQRFLMTMLIILEDIDVYLNLSNIFKILFSFNSSSIIDTLTITVIYGKHLV